MFPRRFPLGALLAGLLLLALLTGIASSMQRNAWMQGFMAGQMSAGADGQKLSPALPYLYGGYGGFGGSHFGFGGFWIVGLLILLFFAGARFMHARAGWPCGPHERRPGAGEGGDAGEGRTGWHHGGHRPPWWGWEDDPQRAGEQPPRVRDEAGRA